ncbi:uncharacterized protein Z518_02355 [Rhinocladiella mackenziei CBS 650.93]|uniref:Major facilitator superfamily (MFS) profile domain-containing protein n=1 Tax=Rhinocladiella mackenziei CBS 650.93 TaxID=1442369 RepID=A0A0D2IWH7_9EURO|nr:uncharacterized protein Z518_02355 [Rhinocladiella mackenziei CBS 650.93]KIX07701.1 hypothetical protein Z518_02355 [Rhinocladiella mackenziei CBS 650.93]
MVVKEVFSQSVLANYGKAIRAAPHEVVCNRSLILSPGIKARLPSSLHYRVFKEHFGISSGSNAGEIKNFVSIVYIGYAWGAGLPFFINDRIGRLWSFRLYTVIYIIGQMVATSAPGLAGLYAARIISGWGIGSLTVTGPMSIVEIAPAEIRGLLTAWFNVAMGIALTTSTFCIVWFSPCIFMFLCVVISFFLCESPRWLFLVDRYDEAVKTLVRVRGLPAEHPRVQLELQEIQDSIRRERENFGDGRHSSGLVSIVKETFAVPSNLQHVQQSLVSYALAQLSGANSITSYFVPILTLLGLGGGTLRNLFLTGMYAMSKLFFSLIGSFFFVDGLGRRKSLFVGICLQNVVGYIRRHIPQTQARRHLVPRFVPGGGRIHLPPRFWVCGGFAHPPGAFIFFAGWCFVSLLYVYLVVPETAGLSVEEIDDVFKGPWFNAYKRSKKPATITTFEAVAVKTLSEEGKGALDRKGYLVQTEISTKQY